MLASTFLPSFIQSQVVLFILLFACDLNTHNLNSDISVQTSPLGSTLVYPNIYLYLLLHVSDTPK